MLPSHISHDNENHLKILALRLLGAPFPGMPHPDLELFVDALPPNLPFTLPLPEGANLLGSLVRNNDQIQIVINAPISEHELLLFYRRELFSNMWEELPSADPIGGFQEIKTVHLQHKQIAVYMTVTFHTISDNQTDIHFYIYLGKSWPGFARLSRHPARLTSPFPILESPDNAKTMLHSGGIRGDYCYSMILLETTLDAASLEAHYREQLSRAGWVASFHTTLEKLALSTWTANPPNPNYRLEGVLLVLNMMTYPNRRFALLYTDFLP